MKLILYSNPDNGVIEKLEEEIFPKGRKNVFGYMQADGNNPKPHYTPFWEEIANRHEAKFINIDSSKKPSAKLLKELSRVNTLTITGGNVFALLNNLRKSGLGKFVIEKCRDKDFVYSGFSAGAIIVTPDIRVARKKHEWGFGYDDNFVDIKDTKALKIVDFEILPHYNPELDKQKIINYVKKYNTILKPISDLEYIIIK